MEPVIKEPATTQEIQIQSYTQMHWETTLEKSSLKFLKKINQASSGSTLKQTDLPFTIGNKMLFLLTGSISWMQGSYIKHLFGANYLLYLKVTHAWGQGPNVKIWLWKCLLAICISNFLTSYLNQR